jgi:hypothetical protein
VRAARACLRGCPPGAAFVVAIHLLAPPAAAGQSGSLLLDAGFSYSLPPASVESEATPYLFLGARLGVPLAERVTWSMSGATGLSLVSAGSSWGSIATALYAALPLPGSLFLDLHLRGEAFTVGDPDPYRAAIGEAEPALRFELGPTTLRAVGYGGLGRSEVRTSGPVGSGDGSGSRLPGADYVSDLWSWGGRFEAYHLLRSTQLRLRLEAYTAPQGDYYGGGAGIGFGALGSLWDADLGAWETPDGAEIQFGIRLLLPAGRDLELLANGGRYAPDPLLDTPAAGSAGAIASWTVTRFGGPEPALYRIEGGSPPVVRFRLDAADASGVELTGDLTDWQPLAMQRTDDGWELRLAVEPGLYRFGFLVDGEWYLPEDADGRTTDDWGNEQATLLVPQT